MQPPFNLPTNWRVLPFCILCSRSLCPSSNCLPPWSSRCSWGGIPSFDSIFFLRSSTSSSSSTLIVICFPLKLFTKIWMSWYSSSFTSRRESTNWWYRKSSGRLSTEPKVGVNLLQSGHRTSDPPALHWHIQDWQKLWPQLSNLGRVSLSRHTPQIRTASNARSSSSLLLAILLMNCCRCLWNKKRTLLNILYCLCEIPQIYQISDHSKGCSLGIVVFHVDAEIAAFNKNNRFSSREPGPLMWLGVASWRNNIEEINILPCYSHFSSFLSTWQNSFKLKYHSRQQSNLDGSQNSAVTLLHQTGSWDRIVMKLSIDKKRDSIHVAREMITLTWMRILFIVFVILPVPWQFSSVASQMNSSSCKWCRVTWSSFTGASFWPQ